MKKVKALGSNLFKPLQTKKNWVTQKMISCSELELFGSSTFLRSFSANKFYVHFQLASIAELIENYPECKKLYTKARSEKK